MKQRRIRIKEIGPKVMKHGDVRAELIETPKLMLFVLRGRFSPDTLEAFSIHVNKAYPQRQAAVVILAPDQHIEVYEEIGADA